MTGFKQVELDQTVKGHFELVLPHCQKQHHGKFDHPHIHHVYAKKEGHHDWKYWVQVKTGTFGNFHEWTVVFQIVNHAAKLQAINMGFHTYF